MNYYVDEQTSLAEFKVTVESILIPNYEDIVFYKHGNFETPQLDDHIMKSGVYHICAKRKHTRAIKIHYARADFYIPTTADMNIKDMEEAICRLTFSPIYSEKSSCP